MTWYLYHQRAEEIIREREREAQQRRLAWLAAAAESGRPRKPRGHTGIRHSLARAIHAAARSAARLAHALDADAEVIRIA